VLSRDDRTGYTLIVDPTIIEAKKREAQMTYVGVKGYRPVVATLKEHGLVVAYEFREGNDNGGKVSMLKKAFAAMPRGRRIEEVLLDAEYYSNEVIEYLESQKVRWAIAVDKDAAVSEAISLIPEGHWQPLPVSYLGFAYGAAVSWGYENNYKIPIQEALSTYAFDDPSGVMGKLVYDLGNVHQQIDFPIHNSTILFNILQVDIEKLLSFSEVGVDLVQRLQQTLVAIDEVMVPLLGADLQGEDSELIYREFEWAANMLRHACKRGIWVIGKSQGQEDSALQAQLADEAESLITEYKKVWHARNRPGGFKESLDRMEAMRSAYF